MPDHGAGRESARRSLFDGELDLDDMGTVLSLYRDLFDLTGKVLASSSRPSRGLTGEQAGMRLAEGFTLLDPGDLLPPRDELQSLVLEVLEALERHSEDPAGLQRDLSAFREEPTAFYRLAEVYLKEGEEKLRERLETMGGVNPEVVMFVLFNALKGVFLKAARRCEHVDTTHWGQGRCPVCGGEPAVSFLMGEGGRRYLVCYRCETRWRFRRLACPYCGFENPRESGRLSSDAPAYRNLSASVCSECEAYIKTWRVEGDDLGDFHPEVEDLKTPGFDRAVEEEGYSRGAPNIFGVWIGTVSDEETSSPGEVPAR